MTKALALFSGGLDSLLAARLVMGQGVEVIALHFITPFFNYNCKGNEDEVKRTFELKYGVKAMIIDVTEEYVEMIRNPRYGYGKNFNPCLDCKIFMMGRAKKLMEELGADFIVSGEVLGQRPMSQRRDAMRIVERDSGLDYYLLRPLSAKLLKPTYPEEHGLIDREKLLDISGRSRKRQIELAERLGITEYKTPAGGCMLTDPILSKRIEFLLKAGGKVRVEDLRLMSLGRHFLLPGGMLYVGRNEADNNALMSLAEEGDYTFKAKDVPGPVSLLRGRPGKGDIHAAAAITARYADTKGMDMAEVVYSIKGGTEEAVSVPPAGRDALEGLRARY